MPFQEPDQIPEIVRVAEAGLMRIVTRGHVGALVRAQGLAQVVDDGCLCVHVIASPNCPSGVGY